MKFSLFFLLTLIMLFPSRAQTVSLKSETDSASYNIENLIAFAEIYNCVRYFYPSKEAQSIDWDKFAIHGVRVVHGCQSKRELIENLNILFTPLCTELQIDSIPINSSKLYPLSTDKRKASIHYGSGKAAPIRGIVMWTLYNVTKPYYTKVKSLRKNDSVFWYQDSASCLFFAIPTAAINHKSSNWETLKKSVDTILIEQMKVKERIFFVNANISSHRLASIIIAWGNFRHFYPYKDLISVDWTELLQQALEEALYAKDYVEFYFALRKMLAPLNDGHIEVFMFATKGLYEYGFWGYAPRLFFESINDTFVVKQGIEKLPKGSIIDSINGLSIQDFTGNKGKFISASPQFKEKNIANELLFSYYSKDSIFNIAFTSPDGDKQRTSIFLSDGYRRKDSSEFVSIKENVCIFSFSSRKANSKELHKTLKAIHKDTSIRGIVFDIRNSKFMDHKFLGYFTDSTLYSAPFKIPVVRYPKQEHADYKVTNFKVKPKKKRINIPVVFIINGSVLSYGESVMGIVEHYKLGYIVGTPTAGINGDVASLPLPVHRIHTYTGMRVDKHNGMPLFCVGITPTHLVSPTVHDYIEGKDRQMEKAFELIQTK